MNWKRSCNSASSRNEFSSPKVRSNKERAFQRKIGKANTLVGKELSGKPTKEALQLYHQNIQGLRCKTDELVNFLYPEFPHILCLSEHHLNQCELETIKLGNYTLGASYCRCSLNKGGVCIYVHRDLSFSKIDLSYFSTDQHLEACAILLSDFPNRIYIISIYRAPSGNFTLFLKKLETILNLRFSNNTRIVLCGDINVNYLTDNDKKKKLNLLLASYNMLSTVNFPTRIQNGSATAIDDVFIDVSLQGNYVIYPLSNGLSDHDAQLIVLTEAKTNVKNGSDRGKK
jgi:exonuclease III